tara:strand:- start:1027 stop:1254 length:228 start_codon:yes stop_codon:yes gene_type:complete
MYPCKNKFFKKLLFFSTIFLAFSFFYYQFTCASAEEKREFTVTEQTKQVITQQREIITSLKKIEDRMVIKNVSVK